MTTLQITDYEQALTKLGYSFRLNLVTDRVEANGKAMDDITLASIRAQMRAKGFGSGEAVQDNIMHLAKQNSYHPIRAYLTECGINYDGQSHITLLAAHFEDVTTPNRLFDKWLRRWLIGAVAKVMRNGDVHNCMLVLDGPQYIGKSFFARWLTSGLDGYFCTGRIDPDSKDCLVRYTENFVWEVAELGATTRKADIDALKDFISRETVNVRRPYGRFEMKRPAIASLISTVNNSGGFLVDSTGNRRFLVSTIKSIDWQYSSQVSVSQVWGEAFNAYQRGENWLPSVDELQLSEENNEEYFVPNALEDYLSKYFELDPADMGSWTSSADIIQRLQDMGYRTHSSNALAQQLATTLTKMGHQKQKRGPKTGRAWGYTGVRIPSVP